MKDSSGNHTQVLKINFISSSRSFSRIKVIIIIIIMHEPAPFGCLP